MVSNHFKLITSTALFLFLTVSVWGTHPVHRTFDRFEDFQKGEHKGISLTGDGRLIIAPALVEELNTEEAFIYSAAADQMGVVYLGSGNNGKVYRVGSLDRVGEFASLDEPGVYAVAVDSSNQVYVGTGPDGKVYRLNSNGEPTVFFEPNEKYIWDIKIDSENNLYVATGPDGVIYKVNPSGEGQPFWDSQETHIVSMEWDLDKNLVVGTAPSGMLVRVSRAGKPFVIYDSSLEEMRAIRVDRYGNIYAAALSGGPDRSGTDSTKESSDSSKTEESKVTVAGTEKGSKLELYKINRQNLADTLYSSDDQLAFDLLVRNDGSVLLATGNKGRIVSISPQGMTKILVDSSEEQVTRLVETASKIYAITSNLGKVFSISSESPEVGVYESEIIDAGMTSLWGIIRWKIAGESSGGKVSLFTRSGNTENPDRTWSDWQGPYENPAGSTIGSDPARFLQWKLEYKPQARGSALLSEDNALESLSVSYMQQNVAPKISSLTVHSPGVAFAKYAQAPSGGVSPGGPDGAHATLLPKPIRELDMPQIKTPQRTIYLPGARSISWEAKDPNEDDLRYSVSYKMEGSSEWILDEDELADTQYTIDAASLPDGIYRVKVVASDEPGNPENRALRHQLISKPFVIANSLPTFEWSTPQIQGRDVSASLKVSTTVSPLYKVEFSVSSGSSWKVAFPEDGITDQQSEDYEINLKDLPQGEHLLFVRAVDLVGNVGTSQYRLQVP